MTDLSHLDWDTANYDDADLVPGEPYEVATLGKQLGQTADLIRTQSANLRNLVDGNGWDSPAGRKFQDRVSDAADKLAKAHHRYQAASDALGDGLGKDPHHDWANALDHAQDLARKAIVKGKAAYDESRSYGNQIKQLDKNDTSPAAVRMHDQKGIADSDLLDAQHQLQAALDFRDARAKAAASAIRDAIDHDGLKNPKHHWWDTALDVVAKIGHWAGVAAAFLGVAALLLSWVPVLGEVLGALALIASVVALVCDTVSAMDGRGTWLDVAIDAIGVLSFGAGRLLGTAAKEATVAVKASEALKDFQALDEIGVESSKAWDVVESLHGMNGGDVSKALNFAPTKLLPDLKAMVKASVNPKLYIQDIGDAAKEWPGFAEAFNPKNGWNALKGFTTLKGAAGTSFRTIAIGGRTLFTASQALPLAAGWSNLGPVSEAEKWITAPNLLGKLKEVPGVGSNGIPFYNWHWTPQESG